MMDYLRVRLQQPTLAGRIYYRPDPQIEPHILFIASVNRRRLAYTININGGEVLIGITADRILQDVEFLIPRRAWNVVPRTIFPQSTHVADLVFPYVAEENVVVEWPRGTVSVTTDVQYSYAYAQLGESPPGALWVALSEQCFALVAEDLLKGFFVALTNRTPTTPMATC